jgi:hypothetical protein
MNIYKKKLLQVNLFINDSIKSFSLEKKTECWLVNHPRGVCFSVIGSRRLFLGQERDFVVSSIPPIVVITAKLKGNGLENRTKKKQML